ncbi:hypothetical protein C8R46DRAFT_1214708 [Mycena filopes]|nr:hypothetical protein C8R46DRAFT_1214708 [Mycena filopes]
MTSARPAPLWPVHPTTRVALLHALFRHECRTFIGTLAPAEVHKLLHHTPDPGRTPAKKLLADRCEINQRQPPISNTSLIGNRRRMVQHFSCVPPSSTPERTHLAQGPGPRPAQDISISYRFIQSSHPASAARPSTPRHGRSSTANTFRVPLSDVDLEADGAALKNNGAPSPPLLTNSPAPTLTLFTIVALWLN